MRLLFGIAKFQGRTLREYVGFVYGPNIQNDVAVSKNKGTPKSSILIGFSFIFTTHFGGVPPIFPEPPREKTCFFCSFLFDEAWRSDGLPTFHNAFPQSFNALSLGFVQPVAGG